jgi:glycosyltransferase involved in cell wall biosynthesis
MFPLVSIVIPAKGDLRFFSHTLKSIDDSIFRDFEVVVIDDGIFSDKKIWLTEYFKAKQEYKMIMNQGVGIVSALNTGISNSSGIYIARLDADDCMSSDRLKIQLDFLNKNPSVGVVGTQVTYINQHDARTGLSEYPHGRLSIEAGNFRACQLAHPSVMFRKNEIQKVGGYQVFLTCEGREYAEDFYLWSRLTKHTEIWNLGAPLTLYRKHANQVSVVNQEVTALAAELVYLKLFDSEDKISIPIMLDSIDKGIIKIYLDIARKKVGAVFALQLKCRFLLTQSLPNFYRIFLFQFSKLLRFYLRNIKP